uniref:Chitin-binding type-2 domain-containing protein n=1 Tax=Phlebotomus papatasi TaxID=29031 RepID=A0A1B0EZL9_PHLPP
MHGRAVERSCRPGFHFDATALECRPPAAANCTLETDPCPPYDDPENIIFHPDENFCNRFHICYRGEKMQHNCGEGLYWDRVNEFCTFPEEADCPTSIVCPNIPGISYEPHPNRCESYFICINGNLVDVSTCSYPMIFDIHERNCNTPDIAQCIRDPCIGTVGHVTIPNPEDCREVVFCQNGRLINTQMCPDGHISDQGGICQPGDPETCEIFPPPDA